MRWQSDVAVNKYLHTVASGWIFINKISSFTALQYINCVQREDGSEEAETCSLKLLIHKILI